MLTRPKISLLTILLFFICAAVGLTCGTAPQPKDDPSLASLNIHFPRLNLYHACLYAASMAMVIGLLRQAAILRRCERSTVQDNKDIQFGYRFAIAWRVSMALLFCICLVGRVLLSRNVVQLPEYDMLLEESFPDNTTMICVIVVLTNSVERWQQKATRRKQRGWLTALAFMVGVVLALILVPDTGMVPYLVHIATQGIERAAPARFQRLDAFPDQQAEGFRLFWLSLTAVIAVALAAAGLMIANALASKRNNWIAVMTIYVSALATAAAFCIWYHKIEFHRISPDLASVGVPGNWVQRLSGMIVLIVAVSCGAYRLTYKDTTQTGNLSPNHRLDGFIPLYEHYFLILLLIGAPSAYLVETLRYHLSGGLRLGWQRDVIYRVGEYLRSPETYLLFAVGVLSAQLSWLRWKRKSTGTKCELAPLDRQRFTWNWLALALIAIVGLPTIAIYSFTFWLGPWYLLNGQIPLPQ